MNFTVSEFAVVAQLLLEQIGWISDVSMDGLILFYQPNTNRALPFQVAITYHKILYAIIKKIVGNCLKWGFAKTLPCANVHLASLSYILSITLHHTNITSYSYSVHTKTHFGRTPLNSLSLITISLEWVHELSSFLLKRILKYTVIKMHSASFFINGLNCAQELARCVAQSISFPSGSVQKRQTNNVINILCAHKSLGPFGDKF